MTGLVVSARIPAVERELIAFMEHLDKDRSKVIIDALKLYLARFDMSFIHTKKKQLTSELKHYQKILDWKKAWDNMELEKIVAIQQSGILNRWVDWYNQKPISKREEWLNMVIKDIRI